jgi:hypothetical protein
MYERGSEIAARANAHVFFTLSISLLDIFSSPTVAIGSCWTSVCTFGAAIAETPFYVFVVFHRPHWAVYLTSTAVFALGFVELYLEHAQPRPCSMYGV